MRVAILLGGERPDAADLQRELAGCQRVICADHGADWALEAGCVPSLLLGDMDSVSPETRAALVGMGVPEALSPVHKDETDGQLAVDRALEWGAGEVVLLGGFGGRYDHALATYSLLRRLAEAGVRAWAVGGDGRVEALGPGREMCISGRPGETFSVMPFSDGVVVEYLTGAEYPLQGGVPLPMDRTLGVSNVLAGVCARLRLRSGWALVFTGVRA